MPATTSSATTAIVLLHPDDNICIAARPLDAGAQAHAGRRQVTLSGRVPLGHKIALEPIAKDQPVVRYGQTIGFATCDIEPGDWVHSHNLSAGQFNRDYEYATQVPPDPAPIADRTFAGYRRADGKAGTRNYIAIISSVNCSASVSKYIAQRFDPSLLAPYSRIDGVLPLTHKGGCAMQYGGEEHQQLNRVLAGFAKHPNIGGYLLVGLGCETGAIPYLVERSGLVQIGGTTPARQGPPTITIQDCGGVTKTVEEGIRQLTAMLPRVNDVERVPIPASELILGLECGGSDGNSGVSANPALGVASDLLVACGGTAVLSETTEIYGAEHLLTRRARTREVGEKLIERIRWWERYAEFFGVVLDNNPSPGNKEGGLTTIYEKSLGAIAKGGSTALNGVYRYAEPITSRGFVIMDTPGFDPASITGMVAGGCNVVAFTTGRGSCYGCKPVPSIKIASNTPMYERLSDDMDVNAGVVLEGERVYRVGQVIFETILGVASGSKTKSEQHGLGEEEFAPWSIGPLL